MALAARERLDLVISDLGLPDGNGRDLMAQLSERYRLRGIAMTGLGPRSEAESLRGGGFVEALIKPVDFGELLAAVHGVAAGGCEP
ncbi:MAG TPA: response regulator [Phycisphaerae bacterium]|nr:response regulator [Phycisphaerae bacterium]